MGETATRTEGGGLEEGNPVYVYILSNSEMHCVCFCVCVCRLWLEQSSGAAPRQTRRRNSKSSIFLVATLSSSVGMCTCVYIC